MPQKGKIPKLVKFIRDLGWISNFPKMSSKDYELVSENSQTSLNKKLKNHSFSATSGSEFGHKSQLFCQRAHLEHGLQASHNHGSHTWLGVQDWR